MEGNREYYALCEKYAYMIDETAVKFGLTEDERSETAVCFCEVALRCATEHYNSYPSVRLRTEVERFAKRLIEKRVEPFCESYDACKDVCDFESGQAWNDMRKRAVHEIIYSQLTPRDASVIEMRFFDNKTLQECGDLLGMTRERIRQIETRALTILRRPNIKGQLEEYHIYL